MAITATVIKDSLVGGSTRAIRIRYHLDDGSVINYGPLYTTSRDRAQAIADARAPAIEAEYLETKRERLIVEEVEELVEVERVRIEAEVRSRG